jgi:UDP-3-O-[3-hydroxymyristoyl] glucosamine N-acyltransferase
VHAVAPLDRAGPEHVSFLASARYQPLFETSRAGVVLVAPELADAPGAVSTRVIVSKPHEALLALLPRLYAAASREPGVHASAVIGRGVAIGEGVTVGPGAVIGDGATLGARAWIEAQVVIGAGVQVGDDAHIYPHVTIYPNSRIGRRVALHSGVRIGSDGFGYVYRDGAHQKLPHVGGCIIEDDVEIGANTTVDRGSIDDTVIGAGTKIDNLVQVAHNVRIGRLCLIMSQVGIAGSAHIEDGCIIAGQAGVAGHNTIGKGARLAAQGAAFGDIPPGETWSGYPARPHKESLRTQAAIWRLAGMVRPLERLLARESATPKDDAGGAA